MKVQFFDHVRKEHLQFDNNNRDSEASRTSIMETWSKVAKRTSGSKDKGSSSKDTTPGTWGSRLVICPLARITEYRFTPHQLLTAPAQAMLMLRKCGFRHEEIARRCVDLRMSMYDPHSVKRSLISE